MCRVVSVLSVAVYPNSSSNHNYDGNPINNYKLLYILIHHQTTTDTWPAGAGMELLYILIHHQTTTGTVKHTERRLLLYILIHHQTTTGKRSGSSSSTLLYILIHHQTTTYSLYLRIYHHISNGIYLYEVE